LISESQMSFNLLPMSPHRCYPCFRSIQRPRGDCSVAGKGLKSKKSERKRIAGNHGRNVSCLQQSGAPLRTGNSVASAAKSATARSSLFRRQC
jgi:hypothetical protein